MTTPEAKARKQIDKQLIAAGWIIQDRNEFDRTAGLGVAVREFLMDDNTEADYLLFVDGKACGVVEAKKVGESLSGVENQSNGYACHLPEYVKNWQMPLPFIYETTGVETFFRDGRDENSRSRKVFSFHQPATLLALLQEKDTFRNRLKHFPPLNTTGLRKCQIEAISGLEDSLIDTRPRSLIQMATGAGKTYTACNFVYRLLKHGKAKRILFLVDRNNLGRQTKKEFENFRPAEENRLFTDLYIAQHLQQNKIDKDAKVVITTIQRLYSMLNGEKEYDASNEDVSAYELSMGKPKEVVYNAQIPPEFFDVIITDECHRSIYGDWRQVLEYFDAFIIGLTATPSKQTLGYFNKNIVSEYPYERSVADGVNVDYQILRIKTEVSENGGKIDKSFPVPVRDKSTRAITYEHLDEDKEYKKQDIDRSVVVPNQIRTIMECYKASLWTDLFPDREPTWVPKTLIFAKDDAHAEEIVRITREVFGQGNNFCKKITYNVTGEKPEELIKEFRVSPNPRIAVTVDMIATGTDIKPLEVIIFMRDVHSSLYYEQMKGRGVRSINPTDLKSVTPNANGKAFFYLIDAVGVTESKKSASKPLERKRSVPLKKLLEQVAQGKSDDATISSIAGRLVNIERNLEDKDKKRVKEQTNGKLLSEISAELLQTIDPDFIQGKSKDEVDEIKEKALKPFNSPMFRKTLEDLASKSQIYIDEVTTDKVITVSKSVEKATDLVNGFKEYIEANKNEIDALSIIYNASYQKKNLNYENISELHDRMIQARPLFTTVELWRAFELLEKDKVQRVKQPDKLLTNLVQLVRFAIGQDERLEDFGKVANARYELWLGRQLKKGITFTAEQRKWLDRIKDYIVANAAITRRDIQDAFAQNGGILKVVNLFGNKTDEILTDLSLALVA